MLTMLTRLLWLILVFQCCCQSENRATSAIVSLLDLTNSTSRLNHMVGTHDGRFFVAGVDRLLALDQDLTTLQSVTTGPVQDSELCAASGCPPDVSVVDTHNSNQLLLLLPNGDQLLSCGTVRQGSCRRYSVSDLTSSQFVSQPVVANDPDASTVGFIGVQRFQPGDPAYALYVAATFTGRGPFQKSQPAISARSLPSLEYAEHSFSQQSRLSIDVKYRDRFPVHYVATFGTDLHAYFLMVQKSSHAIGDEAVGYTTRIGRLCMNDANFDSYVEVEMECGGNQLVQAAGLVSAGGDFSQAAGISRGASVLVAAFSASDGSSARPKNDTALCVFPLVDIERAFDQNIHLCLNGTSQLRNLHHISGSVMNGRCPARQTGNIADTCEAVLKLSGSVAIRGSAVLHVRGHVISGVQSVTVDSHMVILLGTRSGTLLKVLLSSDIEAFHYDSISLDNTSIGTDLLLDKTREHVFAHSKTKVFKVRLQNCERHSNCSACLSSADPHCGWCSLEKRCTTLQQCGHARRNTPRWLSVFAGQKCINIDQISPSALSISKSSMVSLSISSLPTLPLHATYQCVFGQSASPQSARLTASGLTCLAPPTDWRPDIAPGDDSVSLQLAVRSSLTGRDFVAHEFHFYDCSRLGNCISCTSSRWPCQWCMHESKCIDTPGVCNRQRDFITGMSTSAVARRSSQCPRLADLQPDILLAEGVRTEVDLLVENLPDVFRQSSRGLHCLVRWDGSSRRVTAKVVAPGRVQCQATQYDSSEVDTGNIEGGNKAGNTLELMWNDVRLLSPVNFTLYRCDQLSVYEGRSDCSLCVTLPRRYMCGWCDNGCRHREQCSFTEVANVCPPPRINKIWPLSGPIEGGTLLNIEGSNLGLHDSDVHDRIYIGDSPCELVDFQVSVRIVCLTGPVEEPRSATVRVNLANGLMAVSTIPFTFHDVQLLDVRPSIGPHSGGTTLTLSGDYLSIGSTAHVWLNELPCDVISVRRRSVNSRLKCVTRAAHAPHIVSSITVQVDLANRTLAGSPFRYTADPSISRIEPLVSARAGGREIRVHGTNLETVQTPKLAVFIDNTTTVVNVTVCTTVHSALLLCTSPAVRLDQAASNVRASSWRSLSPGRREVVEDEVLQLRVGLLMDNVTAVRNLPKYGRSAVPSTMLYVSDPELVPFPGDADGEGVRPYSGDTLVFEGERLNHAANELEVRVSIGQQSCNVTSLTPRQLVCRPPPHQPPATDQWGHPTSTNLPLVTVAFGDNLHFSLGYLRYRSQGSQAWRSLAVLVAMATLLITAAIGVLVFYRRRSSEAEREYKRIQAQMDTLESHVRMECKQAFAELQTDITDLNAGLDSTGIPIFDQRTYIMNMFFPGVREHPILENSKQANLSGNLQSPHDTAMQQFHLLLHNRYFLLTFINVLESQRSFSIGDKVGVASLLSVALIGQMEYMTEILRLLLLRLVETTVRSRHPQLMLRRTESVVEKLLTNWLALCLHERLCGDTTRRLFLLTAAMKHQVERGPVDALTHDSRYSLAEDRLLRHQINYSTVTIKLVQEDPHYEKLSYQLYQSLHSPCEDPDSRVQCKVLTCDTISQVKVKLIDTLYKNTPYSLRPSVHDLDLEWRQGRGGHLTLADEDLTSRVENGWKQVNTLEHYGVKESAYMSLTHRFSYAANNKSMYGGLYDLTPSLITSHGGTLKKVSVYHLVRPAQDCSRGKKFDRSHRATIPEIFLTRLLSTKGIVQKYVDELFASILHVDQTLPPSIKWLLDLFDEAARVHGVVNPDQVAQAWKSNSLPLRFWVNFIKNPDFLLDVHKTPAVDACLTVVAQTFMDACSNSERRLGKDSPSSKLLFAKDLSGYRARVQCFFSEVSALPTISDQVLSAHMKQLSANYANQFNVMAAVRELYQYAERYADHLAAALESDEQCRFQKLNEKLEDVHLMVNGQQTVYC